MYKIKVKDMNGRTYRAAYEDSGSVFVFSKGKRRYGKRFSRDGFNRLFTVVKPKKTETEIWHTRLDRAIGKMKKTGLWPEIRERFENLRMMTHEEHEVLREMSAKVRYNTPNDERRMIFGDFMEKFPFAFYETDEGTTCINTDYVYEISDCRLKSMYFGERNKSYKDDIRKALAEKRRYSTGRIEVKYDVTFEYEPDKKKAWYAEEYRGCGNGHYYVALDENTALFVEND